MRITALLAASLAALLLVACAAPQTISTASGNPEVSIEGATRKQVVDHIVDRSTANGMTLRSVSEYKVTTSKLANKDFAAMFLFGSRYDGVPEYRIHYTLIDRAGAVKVFLRGEIVTNPGSAFERVTDVTDGSRQDLQSALENLRSDLAAPSATPSPITSVEQPQRLAADQPAPAAGKPVETRDAYAAERLAKEKQCNKVPTSRLSAKGPGFETYNVACSNGDTMTIRCEYGNCRALQ